MVRCTSIHQGSRSQQLATIRLLPQEGLPHHLNLLHPICQHSHLHLHNLSYATVNYRSTVPTFEAYMQFRKSPATGSGFSLRQISNQGFLDEIDRLPECCRWFIHLSLLFPITVPVVGDPISCPFSGHDATRSFGADRTMYRVLLPTLRIFK